MRVALGLAIFFTLSLTATIVAVRQGGRAELEAQALRLNGEIGGKIALKPGERLGAARGFALSVAEISKTLPHDEALFKAVIPRAIDVPGYGALIAGGGFWPEPGQFTTGVDRRSFFWGRNECGKLAYFDDYNAADGPGYQNEEWYVPARLTQHGQVHWSTSCMNPYSFEPMVTCTAPVWIDGSFRGVSTVDLKLTGLAAFMEEQARAIGGYAFASDHDNRLIRFPARRDGKAGHTRRRRQAHGGIPRGA